MPATLAIELNRGRPYAIDPVPEVLETPQSFTLVLDNAGAGRHVHVRPDDPLASGATLDAGTYFVEDGATWSTPVRIDPSQRPLEGTLNIGMGYGKETCDVTVRIVEPDLDPVGSESRVKTPTSPHERARARPRSRGEGSRELSEIGIVIGVLFFLLTVITFVVPLRTAGSAVGVLLAGSVGIGTYLLVRNPGHNPV